MSNINVRVVGTANTSQMAGSFAKVEAQVAATNAQLARMVALNQAVDASGFEQMSKAAALNSKHFRNAAASSGMFEVQQLSLNRATDDYIKKLNKQQLSFRDLIKQRKIAAAAFKEQLAMERNMTLYQNPGSTRNGKMVADIVFPKEVSAELATAGKRLAFLNSQLKSGSERMVNWGKNTQWAGRQLMVGFTMPMAAAGAAAGVLAYQIDKELTRIQKVYDTTANSMSASAKEQAAVAKELDAVRAQSMQTAMDSARAYGSAAKDTLSVQAELAATGQKGAALQERTNQIMRISTLGEIDHMVATQSMIALQSTLGATVKETGDMFNFMNSVENATSLATADFAAAIPRALGPMKEMSKEGASAQEVLQNLSVLMVAMKERGIEAGEGANAVKALMSRVYRPSKQVSSEWEALGLGDPKEFAEQGSDIMEILAMVGDRVKDLKGNERTQALAGLFGTYQVARMNAMLKGLEGVNEAGSQTARVFDVMQQSAEDWGRTAETELSRQAESISGKWDRAFEEMKIQLASLGKPFVELATVVVNGVSSMIKWFNGLPGAVKKTIAAFAGAAAIAGPLVMLAGLFANLTAQGLKGVSALIGLGVRMKFLDRDSRAAILATELAESAFINEASAANMLAAEINALSAAHAQAAEMAGLSATASNRAAGIMGGTTTAAGTFASLSPAERTEQRQKMGLKAHPMDPIAPVIIPPAAVDDSAEVAKNTEKGRKSAAGFAAATAAMAVGMGLTMTNSDGVMNTVGQMLVLGSLVVPAAVQLGPLIGKAAGKAATLAGSMKTAAVGTAGARAGMVGLAASARGAAVAVAAAMGPIGWAAAAVTVVGVGLFAWHKHLEGIRQEATRLNQSLNSAADKWAESIGKSRVEMNQMVIAQEKSINLTKQAQLYEQYRSGELKQVTKDFGADGVDRDLIAQEHFMELQVEYGLSAKEAAMNVRALYAAAGYGAEEANEKVRELISEIGNLRQQDLGKYLRNQIEIYSDMEYDTEEAETAAKDVATVFEHTFAKAGPEQARKLVRSFARTANSEWGTVWSDLEGRSDVEQVFERMGINSAKALRRAVQAAGGADDFLSGVAADPEVIPETYSQIADAVERAYSVQSMFFGAVADSEGRLGMALDNNIDSIWSFTNAWEISSKTLNYDQAVEEAKRLRREFKLLNAEAFRDPQDDGNFLDNLFGDDLLPETEKIEREQRRVKVNQMNINQGYAEGETLQEAIFNLTHKVKEGTRAAAGEANNAANATSRWKDRVEGLKDSMAEIAQAGMAGVAQDIADLHMEAFEENMNNAIEGRQKYWENQQEALADRQEAAQRSLSNEHERQQRSFDNRWENKTDAAVEYWDNRVEAIDKAIKAEEEAEAKRQKMFDNEIARINRLNDMANRNIDFNVALNAGDLDEAAKIRNDATAADAQWAMERGATAGTTGSERRVEALESRRDAIEDAREADLKRLKKEEERERRSLERRQEQEARHLDEIQEMRSEALNDQAEADQETLQEMWEDRKKHEEEKLELLLAGTYRNEKELKQHMKRVGISYEDFGRNVLKPKGENWASFFGERLQFHMKKAGDKIKSDNMWEQIGKKGSLEILRGMGFSNWKQFSTFLKTGKMPKNPPQPNNSTNNTKNNGPLTGPGTGTKAPGGSFHSGGMIGTDSGSRVGVARTLGGLHSSETLINAQKGEYVVNKDAAAAHRDTLDAINSGRINTSRANKGRGVGGGTVPGMVGLMAGAMGNALLRGIGTAMQRAKEVKQREVINNALFAAGTAGLYGDRSFSTTQLQHAATIASVGSSMGMSARDIKIGIMTAITESGLSLPDQAHSDRDSAGLFQQRPSQGWGTVEQVMDPEYAARKFFEALKGVSNRDQLSPWMAAQTVQRSAFSDGSNYQQYWDEAIAIFGSGLNRLKSGGYGVAGGQFVQGKGGWHKASVPGKGWLGTHDYQNGENSPLYAASDGTIVKSQATTSGGTPGNGKYRDPISGKPYTSFGETITLRTPGGDLTYAHLAPGARYVKAGDRVKGGALIGLSGSTGNSSGFHTHFQIGSNTDAKGWMEAHGIPLKKGAANVNYDNVPAILHKNEAVLTEDLNKDFKQGVEAFANPASIMAALMREALDRVIKGSENAGTGNAAGLNIGTYNVLVSTPNSATQNDLAELLPQTDLLNLTEYISRKRGVNDWLQSKGWGVYGKSGAGRDTAIAYNKSALELMTGGEWKLNNPNRHGAGGGSHGGGPAVSGGPYPSRYATYARFRDKKSGRSFWDASLHTIAHTDHHRPAVPIQMEQFRRLAELHEKLDNSGDPVFFGGDFNPGVLGMKRIISMLGMSAGGDLKGLDHVLSAGAKMTDSKRINAGMSSDHPAYLAQFNIPGLARGGKIKWDNTIANLHRDERVLAAPQTRDLERGLDNLANGGNREYNLTVKVEGTNASVEDITQAVIKGIKKIERRQPQSRRG